MAATLNHLPGRKPQPAERHPTYYGKRDRTSCPKVMFSTGFNVRISALTPESFKQCSLCAQRMRVKEWMTRHPLCFLVSRVKTLIPQLYSILPRNDENALVAILNLGHFFQYDAAQADARLALEDLNTFRASRKFILGLRNNIKEWIKDGFQSLVALPYVELSWTADIEPMGLHAYHAVVSTRSTIDAHRRLISYVPPPVEHDASCSFNLGCNIGWRQEWRNKVAMHLMHPDEGLTGEVVLNWLEDVEINDVNKACKDATIRRLRENRVLTQEEEIVARALRDLGIA